MIGVAAFAVFAIARSSLVDASRESAESAATLTLVILGLWTLYELARPLDRVRTLLLVGLVAGAVGAFTIPFVADFFSLEVPPADVALTIAAAVAAGGTGDHGRHSRRRTGDRRLGDRPTDVTRRLAQRPPVGALGAVALRRGSTRGR